jgi:hypothetical protein
MDTKKAGQLGGLKGGKSTSKKKVKAARANGAKGGRPVMWTCPKGRWHCWHTTTNTCKCPLLHTVGNPKKSPK